MTALGDILSPEYSDSSDYYYMKASTFGLMGKRQLAEACFDSARVWLESRLSATPDVASLLSSLASVYAGLNQNEEAVRMGKRAVELDPVSSDALSGPGSLRALAVVYAEVGQRDLAIELCARLLTIPSNVSVNALRVAPELACLRDDPRFLALLKKYERKNGA